MGAAPTYRTGPFTKESPIHRPLPLVASSLIAVLLANDVPSQAPQSVAFALPATSFADHRVTSIVLHRNLINDEIRGYYSTRSAGFYGGGARVRPFTLARINGEFLPSPTFRSRWC